MAPGAAPRKRSSANTSTSRRTSAKKKANSRTTVSTAAKVMAQIQELMSKVDVSSRPVQLNIIDQGKKEIKSVIDNRLLENLALGVLDPRVVWYTGWVITGRDFNVLMEFIGIDTETRCTNKNYLRYCLKVIVESTRELINAFMWLYGKRSKTEQQETQRELHIIAVNTVLRSLDAYSETVVKTFEAQNFFSLILIATILTIRVDYDDLTVSGKEIACVLYQTMGARITRTASCMCSHCCKVSTSDTDISDRCCRIYIPIGMSVMEDQMYMCQLLNWHEIGNSVLRFMKPEVITFLFLTLTSAELSDIWLLSYSDRWSAFEAVHRASITEQPIE